MSVEPNYPASFYAKLFDLTERRIQQLAKDGIIPKAARGKYPLIGTIKAYVKYLQERALGGQAPEGDLQTEKIRLTKASADKVELEVAILDGSVIPAEIVEAVQSRMIAATRARLLSVPSKVSPQIMYLSELAAVESKVRESIYEALTELSEFKPADYGIRQIQDVSEPVLASTESDD